MKIFWSLILSMLVSTCAFSAPLTTNKVPVAVAQGNVSTLKDSDITDIVGSDVTIGSGVNVGIGTSSPNNTLEVNGSVRIDNGLYFFDTSPGYTGLISTSGTSGIYNADLVINGTGDFYNVGQGWSDYSASSTIVGFSSISNQYIYIKKVGKTVFVSFGINGTSNAATITFTVPYQAAATPQYQGNVTIQAVTNSVTSVGWLFIDYSGVTVNIFPTIAQGNWTNGPSGAYGEFWYQLT